MNRQKTFNTYRQIYPTFVYDSYQYDVRPDGLHITFSFRVEDRTGKHPVAFAPTAFVPKRPFLSFNQEAATLDALVFHIGMAELVSYWKCFCPPTVEVRCGTLDAQQIAFWKKLYYYGLGEFFYTNGITVSEAEFMTIRTIGQSDIRTSGQSDIRTIGQSDIRTIGYSDIRTIGQSDIRTSGQADVRTIGQSDIRTIGCSDNPSHPTIRPIQKSSFLVPIGGGKDSVVSLELLRSSGADIRPLILNPRGATTNCAAAAGFGVDDTLVIQRTLDPTMLQLNSQGALNGHTPFSALLAFYSLLAAQLSGIPSIALSNENSANESTVAGTAVNHQYSKSVEFERDFRNYVDAYLVGYNYFSLLRPLCELQIALLFARTERYFDIFRSCNVGSKQDIWCGHCAKCLFAFIILSPFIEPQRLAAIFGRNLLSDSSMLPLLQELAGCTDAKPFECVGTVQEVRAALSLTRHRWYRSAPLPPLLDTDIPLPAPSEAAALLATFAPDHFLSDKLTNTLTAALTTATQNFLKNLE